MYQRIVVPLDGSELAERALTHAENLARIIGCPLHLVRVIDTTQSTSYGLDGMAVDASSDQLIAEEESASRDYLARVERDLRSRGLELTTEIRRGSGSQNQHHMLG